jgi:hypothetical protein
VYLHVDARVRVEPFDRAIAGVGNDGVTWLSRHRLRWGSPAIVDATLSGVSAALHDGCDYIVTISGQDFPLCPVTEILSFFERAEGRSYVAYWPLPSQRWRFEGRDRTDFYSYTVLGRRETCIPRGEDVSALNPKGRALNELLRLWTLPKPDRHFPSYLRPFGGRQWWNISQAAARYVLKFLEVHPDYRTYHKYTSCPDEIFFQSIIVGTEFTKTHTVVNDALRYWNWPQGANHPEVLRERDLPRMLGSGRLFARKVDYTVDRNVLDRLVEHSASSDAFTADSVPRPSRP